MWTVDESWGNMMEFDVFCIDRITEQSLHKEQVIEIKSDTCEYAFSAWNEENEVRISAIVASCIAQEG